MSEQVEQRPNGAQTLLSVRGTPEACLPASRAFVGEAGVAANAAKSAWTLVVAESFAHVAEPPASRQRSSRRGRRRSTALHVNAMLEWPARCIFEARNGPFLREQEPT